MQRMHTQYKGLLATGELSPVSAMLRVPVHVNLQLNHYGTGVTQSDRCCTLATAYVRQLCGSRLI